MATTTPHTRDRAPQAASDLAKTAHRRHRLECYLADTVTGFQGPIVRVCKFSWGQSNPTYRIDTAKTSYVLRRKPFGALASSTQHAVEREYRVMRGLAELRSAVPVPKCFTLCQNRSLIGAAFYICEYCPGRVFTDPALPSLTSPRARRTAYKSALDVLVKIHQVKASHLEATSELATEFAKVLPNCSRVSDYYTRQLARLEQVAWKQHRVGGAPAIPDMEAILNGAHLQS